MEINMKKKLACMLLMSALVLSVTACGGKQDNGTASATQESGMTVTEAFGEKTMSAEEVAKELQSAKEAVIKALGDNYWPDSEIPAEMLNDTFGVSADLYDGYLGESPMISVNVDTLLIIHAKDGKVEDVENALNAYRDQMVNDTMQCVVSFSVFTDFYDLLFPGSPEDEELGSPSGEPGLLCLGRTGLYFSDAFFHDF